MSGICAHCGQPALGLASVNDERLCHDDARDCYELVTIHRHPTPCPECPGPTTALTPDVHAYKRFPEHIGRWTYDDLSDPTEKELRS